MKIFISMGMMAKSTDQVRVEMYKVFKHILKRLPHAELIDSIIDDADTNIALGGDSVGIYYLGESVKRMAEADIVFFVNNWFDFRGCKIEREIAKRYDKFCVEINFKI
jgi:hypothetical protein